MRRYTKSIDANDIEKIDTQENKDINIKIDEAIDNANNPSLPTLDNVDKEKEINKLENDDLMNYSNLEKKIDDEDDDDEDEFFKQPLMRVHRISIHSKDLGRLRRQLSIQNEKEKEKEVSIDKDLAIKAALNYFGKRLKSFHGERLNSERNRRNNSHSDYFNKNKEFTKNLKSNRTKPNLTVLKKDKEIEENEEKYNRKEEEIKKEMKERKEKKERKEEEIKKDKEENNYDDDKKNEEIKNKKNEDNRLDEENKYTRKYRVMVNRKKYREKNNISHDEKEENSIDYHRKKNKKDDEEKEQLNFTEKKNYKNFGRSKFIINNSPRNKNGENEEIKNIISQRGKQNIIYKKKDISNYYKEREREREREKEREKKQNIKEILNENNSQNPIRVRRYQRILVGDDIDNNKNKNNEKRREREVQKERKKEIEKIIQTPEKTRHSFYRRYRINNDNKDKDKDNKHNISYKANVGFTTPNYSNSMIKKPIKLTNKITNQISLHKISVNNNNSHRSKMISETPKAKESISYTGYLRKILNDKNNLGSKEKDNKRIGVNKRGALQINTNYSNSYIINNVNRREEKPVESKYSRYNAISKDKKYEINHTINHINTEGNIRNYNRKNIFDKKQNYNIKNDYKNVYKNDHKNVNKNVNKNINQNINVNVNKNIAKYVDRRNNNNNNYNINNNNININLNNGYSTISTSTVNRRRILIGKK